MNGYKNEKQNENVLMTTIGIVTTYCCKDSKYIRYAINDKLDDEILNKLKLFHENEDPNIETDLYFENPFTKIFEMVKEEDITEKECDECEYKLYLTMC